MLRIVTKHPEFWGVVFDQRILQHQTDNGEKLKKKEIFSSYIIYASRKNDCSCLSSFFPEYSGAFPQLKRKKLVCGGTNKKNNNKFGALCYSKKNNWTIFACARIIQKKLPVLPFLPTRIFKKGLRVGFLCLWVYWSSLRTSVHPQIKISNNKKKIFFTKLFSPAVFPQSFVPHFFFVWN